MANDLKSDLLGINFSTAASALRKQIIYHLAGKLELLDCYKCGEHIELERFSIEHKESWMQSTEPKVSFFDMDNIAFSHLVPCNTRSSGSGKANKAKTHCPQGHPYSEENTWVRSNGWRECRICKTLP